VVPPSTRGKKDRGRIPGGDTQKAVDLYVVDRLAARIANDAIRAQIEPELVQFPDELVGVGLR